jgi:hypothetical protein
VLFAELTFLECRKQQAPFQIQIYITCRLIAKLGESVPTAASRIMCAMVACMWDLNDDLRDAAVNALKNLVAKGDYATIKVLRESMWFAKSSNLIPETCVALSFEAIIVLMRP